MEGAEVAVDMGLPVLDWARIPLAGEPRDTARIPLDTAALSPDLPGWFSAVNMGNPHGIFFVKDAAALDLARIGPALETHPIFPEKANISFAELRPMARSPCGSGNARPARHSPAAPPPAPPLSPRTGWG